ncbi:MAG: beta-ketoacyl synthase N-terminal-like domain-containing protein [Cyanobacteria bacterium J06643_5]
MSPNPEQSNSLSPIKRALLAVEAMQAKLDAVEYAKKEPIAIIGMGCRFPGGVNNPDEYWQLLHNGIDAIAEIPPDRWDIEKYYDPNPDAFGKMYIRNGGFIDGVDSFNPQFFGISATEAASLDPQQRLLLEVSWEALENSNQAPERLLNSSTGVFVGICANEYNKMMWDTGNPEQIDAYCATGNALSLAAGRLSYTLGLKGPSFAVDTACSSSLVAVHLACQNLRNRDCDMALAGGVHLLLSPESSIAFSRTRMLAQNGRCKSFDATADGYIRGEGCGVIILKRLSDALANQDNILAVIRGSAINHNGRSNSLVAPNGPSQQSVIRKALENGGVEPAEVGYVEVQGTGSSLGEPIEVGALQAVYGKNRSQDQPLLIGTVKTNIGHLEAASGIAGLMKVICSLQQGEIFPHLHFQQPNPYINWDDIQITVPTKTIPWDKVANKRLAGVSAFGFSGTNAHVILSAAPIVEPKAVTVERSTHILTITAKTPESLKKLAKNYENYLNANPDLNLGDICFSANTGRSHFQHRLFVAGSSTMEVGQKLAAFNTGNQISGLETQKAKNNPQIAFLFPGENSDYIGIGRKLYETQPSFRKILENCEEFLRPYLKKPLLEILYSQTGTNQNTSDITYRLTANFALEYALFELWKSWGIEPALVAGYGVGEYVAATVAGIFTWEEGLKLSFKQARLMQVVNEVGLGTLNTFDNVDSIQVKSALEDFENCVKEIAYSQPQIPFISNQNNQLINTEVAKSDYWYRKIRESIEPANVIENLNHQECEIVLELGIKPVLSEIVLSKTNFKGIWLSSLNPAQEDWQQIIQTLGRLYLQGAKVDWLGFDKDYSRINVQLPTYQWEKQRYWIENSEDKSKKIESESTPINTQSSMLKLLMQQDTNKLTKYLEATGKFSQDELKLFPKLIDFLTKEEKQQLTESSSISIQSKAFTAKDIEAWLINKIAVELGVNSEEIDIQATFDSYGLDSMLAIGIASAGKQFLGIDVSPLMLMHYPTIESLANHLAQEITDSETEFFEI